MESRSSGPTPQANRLAILQHKRCRRVPNGTLFAARKLTACPDSTILELAYFTDWAEGCGCWAEEWSRLRWGCWWALEPGSRRMCRSCQARPEWCGRLRLRWKGWCGGT